MYKNNIKLTVIYDFNHYPDIYLLVFISKLKITMIVFK